MPRLVAAGLIRLHRGSFLLFLSHFIGRREDETLCFFFMYLPGPGQRFLTLKSAVKPSAPVGVETARRISTACHDSLKHYLGRKKSRGGENAPLRLFIRGCVEKIAQCDRTLQDREQCGCRLSLLLDYFTLTFFQQQKKERERKKREATRVHGW